jgi:anthranilate phosphoribosyltransferase
MTTESDLRRFGAAIQGLIGRQSLSQSECRDLMAEVLSGAQPDLHQGAFLAALVAKGETAEEIAGVWQAIDELDTVHPEGLPADCFENSGTGMDPVKTFNISTLAALIAAAGGVRMARHGARALTSTCGTVDLCEAFGVGVEVTPAVVAESIRTCGIGLFNGMSGQIHPSALFSILSVIRFGSTLNIAASLASPARPRMALRGVYHPSLVTPVAKILPKIGIERAWVVHGLGPDGSPAHDELSVTGESVILDIEGAKQTEIRITPESLGLGRWKPTDLAPLPDRQNAALDAVRILAGKGSPARNDAVILNAAACLFISGKTTSLPLAITSAKDLLKSGAGLVQLRHWVQCQNGDPKRLEALIAAI